MCGIAGIVGVADRASADACVRAMTRALARRGPDGEGVESWPGAALGHRRLSIFDLSDAGRQPMLAPDGDVAVVFNGAIYNFVELRAELEARGYVFRSRTDTEVLIHGYRAWGMDALLSRLRGMYAIGLWDDRVRTLFLVRDRLGVKPLYYAEHDGQLAFASTARALRLSGLAGEIDPVAMAEYLEFGYVTDARSIYRGIRKVPAATVLAWRDGRMEAREYWRPPAISFRGTFDDAVDESRRLLLQAVKRRLQADVPVGALLSGGIDSSLVCWAIRELRGDITAFTVGTPGDPVDESEDARRTARELGLRHELLSFAGADIPDAEELVDAYGEPFACGSALGMLRLSKAVKASATVLLVGDGGDDVFLGYPEYRTFLQAERLARTIPAAAARLWRRSRGVIPRVGILRRGRHFLDYATGGLGAVTRARDSFTWLQRAGIAGERLDAALLPHREIAESLDAARDVLTTFLEYDRHGRFVGEYMTKVDGATMHYGLEARAPFLDADLGDFARALPYELRLHDGRLKAVLRELARREIGARVARGRKRGFVIPAQRWMLRTWRAKVDDAFRHSTLAEEGWIRSRDLWRAWEHATASANVPQSLWYVYVLELWFRRERALRRDFVAADPRATQRSF
jgi:asparagine synthase (glutamine-hydrolysing)